MLALTCLSSLSRARSAKKKAIEALKIGATDYVLKTRLSRLVPSVQRALREARERAERKKAEDALPPERERTARREAEAIEPTTGSLRPGTPDRRQRLGRSTMGGLYEDCPCAAARRGRMASLRSIPMTSTHPDDQDVCSSSLGAPASRFDERGTPSTCRWATFTAGSWFEAVARCAMSAAKIRKAWSSEPTVTDVTRAQARRATARRGCGKLEADLAHIEPGDAPMGELAASLAHEIKQPITAAVMDANTSMIWLSRDPPDLTEARSAASRMVAGVTRAAGIIDRVRSLYGRGAPEREVVDLNEILREMRVLLRDMADRRFISIRGEFDPGLPRTTADRIQLQQVLMNLMLNGIEAMRETGGDLTIASKRTEQGQLLISVSDFGVGLSVDQAERIFDAFFTTKPQGTGMGLSISRRIVESHGGRLWASPNAGRGAIFQFTLPGEVTAAWPQAV